MKSSREGLVLMALGAVLFVLGAGVADTSTVKWIGAVTFGLGLVAWQWHARRGLRKQHQED